jgi:DivIVA domain-containing protein
MTMNAPGTRFSTTKLRPGYARDEVDRFVARIEQTLGGQAMPGDQVTADDVRLVRFRTVRLRPGYDQREVDEALSTYEEQLRQGSQDLRPGQRDTFLEHGEYRLEAGHLQHLARRGARASELQLPAALAGVPVRGQQDIDPRRVAEVHARHVHDQLDLARTERRHQLGLELRCRIKIDLTSHRHDGVIALSAGRDL